MSKIQCEACGDEIEFSDGTICQKCCDHSDSDYYCCLICGKELLEDRMSHAYDMAKASRRGE